MYICTNIMTIQILTKFIKLVVLIEITIHVVHADYNCLCNYNVELRVQSSIIQNASILGYMYEFDCKPVIQSVNLDSKWFSIAFEKQLGYVHGDGQTVVQTCAGSMPDEDRIPPTIHQGMSSTTTVTSAQTTETSAVLTTSYTTLADSTTTQAVSPTSFKSDSTLARIPSKLTTSSFTKETITNFVTSSKSSSTASTSTSSVMPTQTFPSQHSLTSPSTLLGDPSKCGAGNGLTKMTQHGRHCYQIVGFHNYQHRPWFSAELYCKFHGGHLLSILHEDEEEYTYNLLKYRNLTKPVWIGLNDRHGENFKWSSGEPLNWQPDWVPGDSLTASCVVFDPAIYPGQWRNINCHTRHAFICEYNTSINNNGMNLIG